MFKNLKMLAVLGAVSLAVAAPVHAIDLGLMGSFYNPDDGDDNWGAGVKAGIPLGTDHVMLEGRGYYFPEQNNDGGDIGFIPVDLGLALHLSPKENFDPYAVAGISYVFVEGDDIQLDDEFGAYLGGGAEFALGPNTAIFGEAIFRFLELDRQDGLSDDNFNADGLSANVGIRWRI